jgi:hypothetical protein
MLLGPPRLRQSQLHAALVRRFVLLREIPPAVYHE